MKVTHQIRKETDGRHNVKRVSPSTRLYVLLARDAPVGVIFRRGPSKQVLLIKWGLTDDTFEHGQWFKGRIYERRCDLSPDGNLLFYFAANWKPPYASWSAISHPPFLTALALWPKGDGWGGGGEFTSNKKVKLNHREQEMTLAPEFLTPKWLKVTAFGERSGWGEDDPVFSARLQRDGWTSTTAGTASTHVRDREVVWQFQPPITWRKPHPLRPRELTLQMSISGIHERDGSWYVIEHALIRDRGLNEKLGRTEWADWSSTGDLLFSRAGCLFRVQFESGSIATIDSAQQIADFSDMRFEDRAAPDKALQWPRKPA